MFSVFVVIVAERNLFFLITFIVKPSFREIMVVVFKVSNEVLDFLGVMHGTQLCTLPPLTRGNRSYELTLR